MLRMSIKRADGTLKDETWVCRRIESDPESSKTVGELQDANESLPVSDEVLNEENEMIKKRRKKTPYLVTEIKNKENKEPWKEGFGQNNTGFSASHNAEYSYESTGKPCSEAVNLSGNSDCAPINVSFDVLAETQPADHSSLRNANAEQYNMTSSAEVKEVAQGKVASYASRSMWSSDRNMSHHEAGTMAPRISPSPIINSSLNTHQNLPISSSFVSSRELEINAQEKTLDYLEQKEATYGRSSDHYNSMASSNCRSVEYNSRLKTIKEMTERIKDGTFNPVSQNSLTNPNLSNQNIVRTDSNNAFNLVNPPKKRKSRAEESKSKVHCYACEASFKSKAQFKRHESSASHIAKIGKVSLEKSVGNDITPKPDAYLPTIPLPTGPMDYQSQLSLFQNYWKNQQFIYQSFFQDRAKSAMNQSEGLVPNVKSSNVKTVSPGAPEPGYPEQLSGNTTLQRNLGAQNYVQNPNYILRMPVNTPNYTRGNFFPLANPQPGNSPIENGPRFVLRYPQNKTFRPHNLGSPSQIPPGNLNATFKNPGVFPTAYLHQNVREFFRVYHCQTCLVFATDSLQELEQHLLSDRTRTPFDVIVLFGKDLFCELCHFRVGTSTEMQQHCKSGSHIHRVEYYNHVMEGNNRAKVPLKNLDTFYPVLLFCSACEYSIESLVTLKVHSEKVSHLYNISTCKYLATFSNAIEYCCCWPCNVRTFTKRDLLLHARSKEHQMKFQRHPSLSSDPKNVFYIKEQHLKRNVPPRNFENSGDILLPGREKPHLIKENNEKYGIEGNPAPMDLSSMSRNMLPEKVMVSPNSDRMKPSNVSPAATASLQPLPVSCVLCQSVFPEIKVLVMHLQRIHGVGEAGVKWLVSAIGDKELKMSGEKSLSTEDITNVDKPKSIVFSPAALQVKSPVRRMDSESSLSCSVVGQNVGNESLSQLKEIGGKTVENKPYDSQSTVVIEQNVGSCGTAVASEQTEAIDLNLSSEGMAITESSSQEHSSDTSAVESDQKEAIDLNYSSEGMAITESSSREQSSDTDCEREPDKNQESNLVGSVNTDPNKEISKACYPNQTVLESESAPNRSENKVTDDFSNRMVLPSERESSTLQSVDTGSKNLSLSNEMSASHQLQTTKDEPTSSSTQLDDLEYLMRILQPKNPSTPNSKTKNDSFLSHINSFEELRNEDPWEDITRLNLGRESGNGSPVSDPNAEVGHNTSVKSDYSDETVVDEADFIDDCIVEHDACFSTPNSPADFDSQIKNNVEHSNNSSVEHIEISHVFSLANHIHTDNDSDEEEVISDVEDDEL